MQQYVEFNIERSNAYLIKGVDGRRQPTMHTEYFFVNQSGQAQVIKYFCAISPHVDGAILPQAFIIEPIYLSDLSAFVVPANQGDTVRITYLLIKSSYLSAKK
jgi:hypothetical protein